VLEFRGRQGNPAGKLGAVAQLVARFVRNEEARGSNPLSSTKTMGEVCRAILCAGRLAFVVLCGCASLAASGGSATRTPLRLGFTRPRDWLGQSARLRWLR
jgi:hypothetical protein